MRFRFGIIIASLAILLALVVWYFRARTRAAATSAAASVPTVHVESGLPTAAGTEKSTSQAPTNIYAHNLMLRKGPSFRIYVRWLRGQMTPSHRNVNPSFDDPESFFLDIKNGVLRANIGDISNFLNSSLPAHSPLTGVSLSGDGDQIKLRGTLHKVVPLPVEMVGTIAAVPENRIQIHVTKLSVLKLPVKGLLHEFHVNLSDLFHPAGMPGVEVSGNDIYFDTQTLLPPPHIRGKLTRVRVVNPDLEEIYGDAKQDVQRTEQWRNFLRLRDGTIDFGKLTMHYVDLMMIDISNDAWFDLDLTHYQDQLVNGYTRMTPQAGLQIFMPDLSQITHKKTNQNISLEWLK
jgi:hypothetical protein